jgi:hypothetical protein
MKMEWTTTKSTPNEELRATNGGDYIGMKVYQPPNHDHVMVFASLRGTFVTVSTPGPLATAKLHAAAALRSKLHDALNALKAFERTENEPHSED